MRIVERRAEVRRMAGLPRAPGRVAQTPVQHAVRLVYNLALISAIVGANAASKSANAVNVSRSCRLLSHRGISTSLICLTRSSGPV